MQTGSVTCLVLMSAILNGARVDMKVNVFEKAREAGLGKKCASESPRVEARV